MYWALQNAFIVRQRLAASGWQSKLNRKIIGIVLMLALLLAGSQVAFFSVKPARAASEPYGGTFVLGTTEDELVTNMNPLTDSGLAGDVTGITYADSLIYLFDNGSYIPWTASSWTITNGGKTMTFNLVHNAYWMNGTNKSAPFTSQDVLFTFQLLKANSTLDINGVWNYITNVSAPNPYTVVFALSQPSVTIFDYIGSQVIVPYAWHSYYSNISNLGNYVNMNVGHQLSLGPMVLTQINQGTSLTFVENPYFFLGRPHFNKEIVELFKSSSSMAESLEAGTIDGTYVDPNSLFTQLSSYPGIKAVAYKTTFDLNLWFDDQVAPYNNTDFRIGLSYAINKTQILNVAEDGLGGPVNFGGLPWTLSNYYNSSIPYDPFNLTIANTYFEKAGLHIGSNGYWDYANGTTVQLNFIDLPLSDWDTAMTLMQTTLQSDHFSVSYTTVTAQVWVTDLFSGTPFYVASFFNFGPLLGNPWFDLWAEYGYGGYWNFENFNNATVNKLLNESEVMVTNHAQFNSTIREIEGLIYAQMPTIPVMGAEVYYAFLYHVVGGFYPDQQLMSPLDSLYAYSLNATTTTSSSSPSNLILYGTIGGLVIVVIAVASYAVYSRRKSRKD
jgi:ABC-type transport system substrate-binding protein